MLTSNLRMKEETMKKAEEEKKLFGSPTFADLGNGRFTCVETGHEVLAGDKESYAHSKRCRLGLIDHALSQGKPPLDMFSQSPLSRSKLVCKLTGDTVNKNEEHIWKHVNGRRFLHKLEQVERGAGSSGRTEKTRVTKPRRDMEDSDSEESDFWMLKSSSGSESEEETDEGNCKGSHCHALMLKSLTSSQKEQRECQYRLDQAVLLRGRKRSRMMSRLKMFM